jgi:uncharacterized membrane protein YdbT with pleckstrin-like domain
MRSCEACGAKSSADARFCPSCGRELGSAEPAVSGRVGARAASDGPAAPRGEREVLSFRPVAVQGFGEFLVCILTGGIAWVWLAVTRRRDRYRLTNERLELRSGLVSMTNRTIELFRVQDLELRASLFLRMRGAGDLVIRSQDAAEHEVVLPAIPNVREVHETLRSLVNAERRRQRVKVVEES